MPAIDFLYRHGPDAKPVWVTIQLTDASYERVTESECFSVGYTDTHAISADDIRLLHDAICDNDEPNVHRRESGRVQRRVGAFWEWWYGR